MAFAIWSPTISKSPSAAGNGAEEMAGGETEAVRQLESSVTVSSVFRSAREATISAHNQTAVIASAQPQAAFSVGSRLASLNGGILNALLGGLLGGNISLSVMDYNSLVSADVDVLSFTDALATQLHLTGVSYSDVLASICARSCLTRASISRLCPAPATTTVRSLMTMMI